MWSLKIPQLLILALAILQIANFLIQGHHSTLGWVTFAISVVVIADVFYLGLRNHWKPDAPRPPR
jgi:hypothetical protein